MTLHYRLIGRSCRRPGSSSTLASRPSSTTLIGPIRRTHRSSKTFDLSLHIVANRCITHEYFKVVPPGIFSLLAGPLAQQLEGLQKAKELCEAVYEVEKHIPHNRALYAVHQACLWCFSLVIREVLGSLAAVRFAVFPPEIVTLIQSVFKGWGHGNLCEDGFRVIKAAERDRHTSSMRCVKRWRAPHVQEEMARFERTEVEAVPGASPGSKVFPRNFFSATHGEPSIGRTNLNRISGPTRGHPAQRRARPTCWAPPTC